MNGIFDICVNILIKLAEFFGTTYKVINVWIFVIIWPISTILLVLVIIKQHKKIILLKNKSQI